MPPLLAAGAVSQRLRFQQHDSLFGEAPAEMIGGRGAGEAAADDGEIGFYDALKVRKRLVIGRARRPNLQRFSSTSRVSGRGWGRCPRCGRPGWPYRS